MEHRTGIRHYTVFIVVARGAKRHIPFIPFMDTHQVVGTAKVKFLENLGIS